VVLDDDVIEDEEDWEVEATDDEEVEDTTVVEVEVLDDDVSAAYAPPNMMIITITTTIVNTVRLTASLKLFFLNFGIYSEKILTIFIPCYHSSSVNYQIRVKRSSKSSNIILDEERNTDVYFTTSRFLPVNLGNFIDSVRWTLVSMQSSYLQ